MSIPDDIRRGPRIRPAVPREDFDELTERVGNLEQAFVSVLGDLFERVQGLEEDLYQGDERELGEPNPQAEVEVEAPQELTAEQRRAFAVADHEAQKRAASAQPIIIDGQAFYPQELVDEGPPSPEQIAEQANSTADGYVPVDPTEAANSIQGVPEEGITLEGTRPRTGPEAHIQRRYDDRGNPLDEQ